MAKKKKQKEEYEFVVPSIYKNLSANDAQKELNRIREKYGALDPEYVVKESKNEDSVLHNVFDWDDTSAAARFREQQARDLIRNIRVVITDEKVTKVVRAFVNVREAEGSYRSYVPIEKAIINDTAYQDLLQQSKNDMDNFIDKYAQVTELNAVKTEMLKAKARI